MTHISPARRSRPRALLAVGAAVLLALLGAVTAAPADARPLDGPRLNLFDPPSTFPADAPFYVDHGFCGETAQERADLLRPTSRFELSVDGRTVRSQLYLEASAKRINDPGLTLCKQYSTEFLDGLPAGVHELVGCWYYLGEDLGCEAVEVTFG